MGHVVLCFYCNTLPAIFLLDYLCNLFCAICLFLSLASFAFATSFPISGATCSVFTHGYSAHNGLSYFNQCENIKMGNMCGHLIVVSPTTNTFTVGNWHTGKADLCFVFIRHNDRYIVFRGVFLVF